MAYLSGDSTSAVCKEMKSNGASIDCILGFIRSVGFPQSMASFFLTKSIGLSEVAAKKAVIDSVIWSDMQCANKTLQKAVASTLEAKKIK